MQWRGHLHRGKEHRGAMAKEGTPVAPSPSSSQAHQRRAGSPVDKPSCWATHISRHFPHQPEKGRGWWHWWFCVCAGAECLCLSVWPMCWLHGPLCLCACWEYVLRLTTCWTQGLEVQQHHLCQATRFSISFICYIIIYLFPAKIS